MGPVSGVDIVLLCEDKQTDSFVRRFLRHRKFRGRDIRTLPLPDGSRSGEQWVRERYPDQLKAIRQRRGAYLIVVTDADNLSVDRRRAQLRDACNRENVPPRNDRDGVLLIVPRRNIETWLAYLGGSDVDENERYPRLRHAGDCEEHAGALYRMCHEKQELRPPAPPSLQDACGEYRKLQR